ncbi:ABC transporter permease [Zavarzinia sp.]|uniref:ABC transporter permease n=1 Tax=Zavarzinia sp. TaxID=2027920 RepID=UPI0035684297
MRQIRGILGTGAVLALAYGFIYLPVAVLVLFSFHELKAPVPPFQGPTTAWYEALFADPKLMDALVRSIVIAVVSGLGSTVLGFLAAFGLARFRPPLAGLWRFLLLMPLTVAPMCVGIGLLILANGLALPKSLALVTLGHVAVNLPLAFTICLAQMGGHQEVLERAARDLGASEFRVLTRVTVPLLWPALFASFCLCFTFSWDEFIISFFLSGFDVTLPVAIWEMMRAGINPKINAAGTIVFILSLGLVLVGEIILFGRRRRHDRRVEL